MQNYPKPGLSRVQSQWDATREMVSSILTLPADDQGWSVKLLKWWLHVGHGHKSSNKLKDEVIWRERYSPKWLSTLYYRIELSVIKGRSPLFTARERYYRPGISPDLVLNCTAFSSVLISICWIVVCWIISLVRARTKIVHLYCPFMPITVKGISYVAF